MKQELKASLFIVGTFSVGVFLLSSIPAFVQTTYAWFNAHAEVKTASVTTSSYTVSATVTSAGAAVQPNAETGGYSLEENKAYSVTLTATGTSATGFCKVLLGQGEYCTEPFPTRENPAQKTFSFTVQPTAACEFKIVPQWGTAQPPEGLRKIVAGEKVP